MGKVRLKVCRTRKMETVPKNGHCANRRSRIVGDNYFRSTNVLKRDSVRYYIF